MRLAWLPLALVLLFSGLSDAAIRPVPVPNPTPDFEASGRDLVSPRNSLRQRERLPKLAHMILAQRMEHHSMQMVELMWAVIFLEHDTTREVAGDIVTEPKIPRMAMNSDVSVLSSQIPARFFDLQDELENRASDLAAAAGERDDTKIGRAWGRMAETCVACHAAFLESDE